MIAIVVISDYDTNKCYSDAWYYKQTITVWILLFLELINLYRLKKFDFEIAIW
jgi:hypothetical protein